MFPAEKSLQPLQISHLSPGHLDGGAVVQVFDSIFFGKFHNTRINFANSTLKQVLGSKILQIGTRNAENVKDSS